MKNMMEELKSCIGPNEKIMYEGKPNKKCYIFESIFNPLLPFAIVWAIVDFGIMGGIYFADGNGANMLTFLIPFMLLHLMPVWIYLGGVIFTTKRYKNTAYIVTDKAIYVSSGVFSRNINVKPFAEMSHIDLHRGIFDRMFNVGDIIATTSQTNQNGKVATITINSISDYTNVYNMVKKLQTDIYADIMYPNAKRPSENYGYHTEYKDKEDK
ncbi:MAG: PH domain-containing protein [Christensenellales bacterium]